MVQRPQLQPTLIAKADETAAGLVDEYGDYALLGAKAALLQAGHSGNEAAIALWSDVCSILIRNQAFTIEIH